MPDLSVVRLDGDRAGNQGARNGPVVKRGFRHCSQLGPAGDSMNAHLDKLPAGWDNEKVQIYGPYPPDKGRKRWRVQIRCEITRSKKSVTFATEAEARQFIPALRGEIDSPLSTHAAIDLFVEHKSLAVNPASAKSISRRLYAFLPDVPVRSIGESTAESIYDAFTRVEGRFGKIKPATHHAALKVAKELFSFLVRKRLVRANPFSSVQPIGRPNCGKPQPNETEAKKLDAVLFSAAKAQDEGALALLVQLYLGLRSSEVLKLEVGAVEREGQKVSVVRGKTRNARRSLDLHPDVAELLWRICKGRPASERVFATHLGTAPKTDYLYKRLQKFCALAGIKTYCPHSLRGLHSSLALVAGATSHDVAKSLGHASFSTTARHYADPSAIANAKTKRVAAALRASPPTARPTDTPAFHDLVADLTQEQKKALLRALLADI